MKLKEFAYHVMQMRDLQNQYFASGKPIFRDKKILAVSKAKEAEVDSMVELIISEGDAPAIQHKVEVPSYFEKNAIFGDNDFDSNPY